MVKRELPIVFSHADFYIFEKPAGLNFHSESEKGFVVLAEQQTGEKLFAVHRLDKVTSGLIILSRNKEAAAKFTSLFTEHAINKFYLAISNTKPKKKQGWIKGDMAKSRRGMFKLLPTMQNPAITRFYSFSYKPGFRAYILKPYSGKTHQLRVALKSLGAPILGDSLYSGSAAERAYLHAYALSFVWHGEQINCTLLPATGDEYQQLINQQEFQAWQSPWELDW
ncbi:MULTISPECIES: TIGR01621 family pseudouridine synthase [unclassified Pseudoalteromonas]|uniref:TIGR01621 family pseudouridine synthase n=1 Tax=unclassified Pseudoalteromonas TaxID=194690 RepID=UPI0006D689AF|nr:MULTISPECIES: TIGR01621 family pseudouridine synthase [unclassified Pseudoalteromonas]KPZ56331.1 Ribosomal large subunit pseudouridine synthase A [Pseudoalteromonas sp. P1-25]KPZ61172.1 Ribosomal large subunit pseudouridine synthase A [Pseudoalteromonas sp. P1-7a]